RLETKQTPNLRVAACQSCRSSAWPPSPARARRFDQQKSTPTKDRYDTQPKSKRLSSACEDEVRYHHSCGRAAGDRGALRRSTSGIGTSGGDGSGSRINGNKRGRTCGPGGGRVGRRSG